MYSIALVACAPEQSTYRPIAAITGHVRIAGTSDEGVQVTVSRPTGELSTLTELDGEYWFWGLEPARYQIAPAYPGQAFRPVSRVVEYDGSGSRFNHFTRLGGPTYPIEGDVLGDGGTSGVVVALDGDNSGAVLTDAAGSFVFSAVRLGSYTLRPSAPGRTFAPESVVVSGVIDFAVDSPSASSLLTAQSVRAYAASIVVLSDASAYFEFPRSVADGRGTIRPRRDAELSEKQRGAFEALRQGAAIVEFTYASPTGALRISLQLQPDRGITATSEDFALTERLVGATGINFTVTPK